MTLSRSIASRNCAGLSASRMATRPPAMGIPERMRMAWDLDVVLAMSAARTASSSASTVSREGMAPGV